jgi:uncharacterized membrane protein (UPF0127 family)
VTIRAALAVWLGLAAGAAPAQEACREDRIDLRGDWGSASFRVEVVDTVETRARGLMFREEMGRGQGMLFVYDEAGPVSFWMRNTLIPLDMLFMSEDGRVTRIHENAVPGDETPIPGGDAVQFVLEINGGLSEAIGLTVGSEARHPAIGSDALWSCDGAG